MISPRISLICRSTYSHLSLMCSQSKDFNWWFRSGHDKFALADCLSSREVTLSSHVIMINERQSRAINIMWPFGSQLFLRQRFQNCVFLFFFLFFCSAAIVDFVNGFVYYLRSHKLHFSTTFLLKMGSTALFTHLKIILLQCFQFQFSISAKISSI